jgi:prophage antirepressor-like protein
MTEEQKYNTIIPLENSQQIITDLVLSSDKKNDLIGIKDLKIYGTEEDPLFRSFELGELLQLSNVSKNFKNMEEGFEYIKVGRKTFITEQGFYRLAFASKTPFASLFRAFVYKLIKNIRSHGEITKNDMSRIRQELEERNLQIESLNEEKMDLKGKNQVLNYTKQKLEHDVTEYDKSNLSYLEAAELKQLREKYYNEYHIYKTIKDDDDDDIVEVFLSMSNRITKYVKIDTIYLDPDGGFAKFQYLMNHRVKDPKSIKKIKNLNKVSPVYELEHLSELYECIDDARYFDGEMSDNDE